MIPVRTMATHAVFPQPTPLPEDTKGTEGSSRVCAVSAYFGMVIPNLSIRR